MVDKTHIAARRTLFSNDIEISMVVDYLDGSLAAARNVVLQNYKQGAVVDPFLVLRLEAAQLLMDELWACGLRPSEGTGSAGALAATQQHLKDMRTVAFKSLKIPV